ncbi:MAG TPA: hypothetical protein VJV79_02060 [Polyangiaceae bacterium]|nr:hypothetical protein [Polyangiaceae bacterium]
MNTRSLGIALVFVAGCAVGGASARFVVPPANAQQAATLTKWEYMCFGVIESHEPDEVVPKAQAAGAQGWEMVAVYSLEQTHYGNWCFKRAKL